MISFTNLFHPLVTGMLFRSRQETELADTKSDGMEQLERWREQQNQHAAKPWSAFGCVSGIQNWGGQLGKAINGNYDLELWRLVGHAVLIEHPDVKLSAHLTRRIAEDSNMVFLAASIDEITDFPFDDVNILAETRPVAVFLELGPWGQEPDNGEAEICEFQMRLCKAIHTFDPARPVVFFTSTPRLEMFANVLRKVGAFDRVFSLPETAPAEIGDDFLELIGKDKCSPALLANPEKIGHFVKMELSDPDQRDLQILALQRLALDETRKLDFVDLIRVYTNTAAHFEGGEKIDPEARRQTAYHEGGHALVALFMSAGKNMPEYTGIHRARGTTGITVESYTYNASVAGGRMNFSDVVAKVRICLAGRAAEELACGPNKITCGTESDLANATQLARTAFTEWGFSLDMASSEEGAYCNLMVLGDNPSPEDAAHINRQVREFLAREYQETLIILYHHRDFLDALVEKLINDGFIDQETMRTICDSRTKT